jgi:hypothetical protein
MNVRIRVHVTTTLEFVHATNKFFLKENFCIELFPAMEKGIMEGGLTVAIFIQNCQAVTTRIKIFVMVTESAQMQRKRVAATMDGLVLPVLPSNAPW